MQGTAFVPFTLFLHGVINPITCIIRRNELEAEVKFYCPLSSEPHFLLQLGALILAF